MELLKLKVDHDEIIFIDESGFSLSMRRKLGRSARGARANLNVRSIRSKNVTLIAAMSSKKLWTFRVEHGCVNSHVFKTFISDLFHDLRRENVDKALLIMDNVPFHKTSEIRESVAEVGHTLLFLPPYSPFLNPIENLFHQWKTIVRLSNPKDEMELDRCMVEATTKITTEQLKNYCRHSKTYQTRCLQREPIEN